MTRQICQDCGKEIVVQPNDTVLAPGIMVAQRYLVGRLLGQGGFGATYLGFDQKLASRIAIKEYLPYGCVARAADGVSLRANASMADSYHFGLTRFLDEARVLARFRSCRNVVSVFDFFEENGSAYIIMELLQGSTLKELLRQCDNQRMDYARALPILESVLNALTDIHAQNILHRDISPDNIMIGEGGVAKLLDFGAARQALSGHDQKLSIILKPGYAPFEQYLEDGNQGPWSDVYAIAATFYCVLTGSKPVDALQRIAHDSLRRPSELGVTLPPVLEAAVMKGLAVKPEDRFRSAAEFKAELAKLAPAPPPAAADSTVTLPAGHIAKQPAKPAPLAKPPVMTPPGSPAAGMTVSFEGTRGVRNQPRPVTNDGELFEGKAISVIDLARMLQEHSRFLKGQSNGKRIDLSFRRLSGMSLAKANLQDSEMRGALLRDCDLSGANLRGANLFCADMTGAKLVGSNMERADLRGAKFEGANLTDASLDRADCREGVLFVQQRGGGLADVHKERLNRAATFSGAVLQRSSFCSADLQGTDFRNAKAIEANFEQANLAAADFAGAKLVKATFAGANLDGAEFTLADLSGVDTSAPEFAKARIVRQLDDIEAELKAKIVDHQRWVVSLSKAGKRLVM
ncbi:MAG: serine/threonine-protein kinase, partial [Rhodospirillaceae bacterium]